MLSISNESFNSSLLFLSPLIFGRSNKKFVKTNDLKAYLTSVSRVDKFWVR